jgi:hypothetical protein
MIPPAGVMVTMKDNRRKCREEGGILSRKEE